MTTAQFVIDSIRALPALPDATHVVCTIAENKRTTSSLSGRCRCYPSSIWQTGESIGRLVIVHGTNA